LYTENTIHCCLEGAFVAGTGVSQLFTGIS
jgi:hypothetical protein